MCWWMAHYDGPTPKRHVAFSNSGAIRHLNLGHLVGWAKKVREQDEAGVDRVKTVKKYQDKRGQLRYKGDVGLRPSESGTHLSYRDFQLCSMWLFCLEVKSHKV